MAITMVTFGSPAFRLYGIRDFLSLPYDRFGMGEFIHLIKKYYNQLI